MDEWSAVVDDASGQTYYFNGMSGESQWEKPEGWVDEETEDLPAAPPEEEQAPSLSQWSEVLDEGSGQTYYFNTITGESQWEKPDDFDGPEEAVELPPSDSHLQDVTVLPEDDPKCWEELFDDGHQAYYYVNHVTGVTQWEKPACLEQTTMRTLDAIFPSANGEPESKGDDSAFLDNDESDQRDDKESGSAIVGMLFNSIDKDTEGRSTSLQEASTVKFKSQATYLDMEEQPIDKISTVAPPINITKLQHDSPLEEFVEVLKDISFEQFAAKHFNVESSSPEDTGAMGSSAGTGSASFIKRHSRRDSKAFQPGEGALAAAKALAPVSWKEEPLSISLCVMSDAEPVESAVKINRYILGYMGDRRTRKTQNELVKLILEECLRGKSRSKAKVRTAAKDTVAMSVLGKDGEESPRVIPYVDSAAEQLRDEILCQIVRQLRHNPSINSEEKGWHLFLVCLAAFPPSAYLTPYLMSHFLSVLTVSSSDTSSAGTYSAYNSADDIDTDATGVDALQVEISRKKGEIKRLAELCLRTVLKALRASSPMRSHYPTPSEISHLKSGREIDVKVHLADGEIIACKVDSWTTVGQFTRDTISSLGITKPNIRIFCMFEVSNSGEEHALSPEERVIDVVSFHYHDSARSMQPPNSEELFSSFKFVFKARLFFDCSAAGSLIADEDSSATKLLYAQAVHDVIGGKYPLLRTEATVLAGIQAQEMFGNYLDDKALKQGDSVDPSSRGHGAYDTTSLTKFLCREYIGSFDGDMREQLREEVLRCYLKLHGLSNNEAQRSYLTLLRGCKLYGAAFYVANNVNVLVNSGISDGQVVIAITCKALVVVDPVTKKYLLEYRMAHMKSWGYNADTVIIEINMKSTDGAMEEHDESDDESGSDMDLPISERKGGKLTRLIFNTSSPKVIADILKDYNCPEGSLFG